MIPFNKPPFTGNELNYIKEAVECRKLCGDGQFTKKCSAFLEKLTGSSDDVLYPCHRNGGHIGGYRTGG